MARLSLILAAVALCQCAKGQNSTSAVTTDALDRRNAIADLRKGILSVYTSRFNFQEMYLDQAARLRQCAAGTPQALRKCLTYAYNAAEDGRGTKIGLQTYGLCALGVANVPAATTYAAVRALKCAQVYYIRRTAE